MQTSQIVHEISHLSTVDKLFVAEQIFKQLREENSAKSNEAENRRKAAVSLLDDYKNDSELTAFSAIDHDDYYETK